MDGTDWRRTRLPDALSWLRSRSVTLTGGLIVSYVLTMMGVSAQDVLDPIRKTWVNDMQQKQQI